MTHTIFQGPYILRPKDRIYSVFLMTHTISQGPYILRPRDRIFSVDIFSKKSDRIFSALDRIFSADDRIFSADDRIFSARTVYFRPKTVYFQPGPYILPRPYIFKDRIFYFSGPYILLPNLKIRCAVVSDIIQKVLISVEYDSVRGTT